MRLASFQAADGPRAAVVDGDTLIDIAAADSSLPRDMTALISTGKEGLAKAKAAAKRAPASARRSLASATLLLPVPSPPKIICVGLNYADHAREGGFPVPDYPALFMRARTSLTGAGQPLVRPRASDKFDYEAELVIVIGRRCRHVGDNDALDCVFGYTAMNEGSIRDYQRKTPQWTAGKNFDRSGSVGPWIVTADELPRGAHGLSVRSRLNGALLQDGNTREMIFPVAKIVSTLSEIWTLEPGDLIATGTPAGVGHARKPPLWMKAGDTVEVEIEGIGVLRNPVADET